MLGITDLKPGVFFEYENAPHVVVSSEHSKSGRAGAVMRTKIKNLQTGAIFDRTFKGNDQFPEADIARKKGQFLYLDDSGATFMEQDNFEQHHLDLDQLGDAKNFLKEGSELDLVLHDDNLLTIDLPTKVDLEVVYTEPGFKGDSQSTVTKPAKLETGLEVYVPLFIKQGEKIRVNTQTGQYVERVN